LQASTTIRIDIDSLAEIRFGLHATSSKEGSIRYLQVGEFDEVGDRKWPKDEYLKLSNKNESHLLIPGDILFVGKGNRLFAWCYRDTELSSIASSAFFVIRPNNRIIYPEYLTAILNAPQTRSAFQVLGAGTNIFSIRKSELSAYEIPVPAMEDQRRIAALTAMHRKEINLCRELIEEKQNLYAAVISKLIS
jgi:restriction endonuclease S subunit